MRRITVLMLAVVILGGCATVQPILTNSGMPEVTICGISKNEVMEKFAAGLSMKGANIRNTSNYQIVVGRPVDNPLIAALYGSRYDSTPEARVIFTFADVNNCTYIGARLQIVTNPGSGFERITDISRGKDAYQLQQDLEELKSTIERQRGSSYPSQKGPTGRRFVGDSPPGHLQKGCYWILDKANWKDGNIPSRDLWEWEEQCR